MSFISKIDHNDLFDHFESFTDFRLLSGDKTTSLVFPKQHPLIRNLKNSLDEIAARMTEEQQNAEEQYYSGKVNQKFIEMMEATFSSEMPKSTRNRTPFADITQQELFKSNKPKLPKAPKNPGKGSRLSQLKTRNYLKRKSTGVKRSKKSKSFSGCGGHFAIEKMDVEENGGREIGRKLQKFLKKKKKFKKRSKRGCSLMSRKDLDRSYDGGRGGNNGYKGYIHGYGEDNFPKNFYLEKPNATIDMSDSRNLGSKSNLGLKLKKFLKGKLAKNLAKASRRSDKRYGDDHMTENKLQKLRNRVNRMKKDVKGGNRTTAFTGRNQHREERGKKNSFHQFMKNTKTNNSLIKSLRQKMGKVKLAKARSKSRSRDYSKNLVPPIPISDVSKKCLREQITNGRIYNDSLSKNSTDDLQTVKIRSRIMHDTAANGATHKRNSSSRLIKKIFATANLKTTDEIGEMQGENDISSHRNYKGLTNCLNSSEFLRSQMMRAKAYETTDSTLLGLRESPRGVGVKDKRKLNLNFKKMKMDIKAIYSQDNHLSQGGDSKSMKNGNPRISRNQDANDKRIKFPEIEMRGRKERTAGRRDYSDCRRMMAGSVAKKLNELGRGGMRHKKSSSLSRSFGIYCGLEDKRRSLDNNVYSKA